MPHLYEMVSKDSIDALRPLLKDALEAIGLEGLEADRKESNLYVFNQRNWNRPVSGGYEVGPLWVAAMHAQIMKHAHFDPSAPDPFTHRVTKLSIRGLLNKEMVPGWFKPGTDSKLMDQSHRFGSELMRLLYFNGLVKNVPKTNDYWVLGHLPREIKYSTSRDTGRHKQSKQMPRRDAERVEKRIQEEANKPVYTHYTIPALPTEPTPKAILDWAKRTKDTFDKLNARYERLVEEYVAALDRIDKLEKLDNTREWSETLHGLSDILQS